MPASAASRARLVDHRHAVLVRGLELGLAGIGAGDEVARLLADRAGDLAASGLDAALHVGARRVSVPVTTSVLPVSVPSATVVTGSAGSTPRATSLSSTAMTCGSRRKRSTSRAMISPMPSISHSSATNCLAVLRCARRRAAPTACRTSARSTSRSTLPTLRDAERGEQAREGRGLFRALRSRRPGSRPTARRSGRAVRAARRVSVEEVRDVVDELARRELATSFSPRPSMFICWRDAKNSIAPSRWAGHRGGSRTRARPCLFARQRRAARRAHRRGRERLATALLGDRRGSAG